MKLEPSGRRVLIASNEFPPGPGGIGNQAESLAHFLRRQSFDITVLTASRPMFDDVKYDQASEYRIVRYRSNQSFWYKFVFGIQFIVKNRRNFDWIILSGLGQLLLVIPIKVLCSAKTLSIIHGHEVGMVASRLKGVLLKSLNVATALVSVSEFSKSILQSNGISRQISVISNGFSPQLAAHTIYRERVPVSGRLVLATVGAVTRRKGQANVIRAIPLLRRHFSQVEYHLVGMPSDLDIILDLARKLNVTNCVHVHGVLTSEQKCVVLDRTDVFVMLSENLPNGDLEGFGIAVIEANLMGLPAIGSKGTGIEQAIDDGRSGKLIDPKSEEEFLSAVIEIRNGYPQFCRGAREWALAHDWDNIGKKYLEVLNA